MTWTTPPHEQADVLAGVIGHLRASGVEASSLKPADLPDEFVIVQRTGGNIANGIIDEALLLIEVFTLGDPFTLANAVRKHLFRMAGNSFDHGLTVNAVTVDAARRYDDPLERHSRAMLTARLSTRTVPVTL